MSASRTNIILIVADDLGYGDVGYFGNPDLQTPHLDWMAEQGVVLTQHYAGSPICAPARASLLTGRYNHRTGAVDVPSNRGFDRIALSETTIADVFKSAGYATGMVGKWHNGAHDMRYHPNSRGFDEFAGFLNGGMDFWNWVLDYNGSPNTADGRYLTDVFTEEALSFIDRHKSEPFFLYVPYNAPHDPLQAPEGLISKYEDREKFTPPVSRIYAMIERMDSGIGRILESLKVNGLGRDTLVIFTSDNGPVLGGEGEESRSRYNGMFTGSKYDVLEGGIRVPAILYWPDGLPKGERCDELVHFTDWLPTLTGIAGETSLSDLSLDGRNVLDVLRGENNAAEPIRFWQYNRYEPKPYNNAAMRDGRWKLYWPPIPEAQTKDPADNIPYFKYLTEAHTILDIDTTVWNPVLSEPKPPLLFDLENDPYEHCDVSGRYPDRLKSMINQWEAWFDNVLADWWEAQKYTRSN